MSLESWLSIIVAITFMLYHHKNREWNWDVKFSSWLSSLWRNILCFYLRLLWFLNILWATHLTYVLCWLFLSSEVCENLAWQRTVWIQQLEPWYLIAHRLMNYIHHSQFVSYCLFCNQERKTSRFIGGEMLWLFPWN